jgi:hypothetical protein
LSSNEIRRLFGKLVLTGRVMIGHVLHWSDWRRRRQLQAKAAHYRKRLAAQHTCRTAVAVLAAQLERA